MQQRDCSTARLYVLLSKLISQKHSMPLRNGWGAVLEADDDPTFFARYAVVVALCEEAYIELVRAGGSKPDAYTKRFDSVRNVFKRALNEPVAHAKQDLNEATMIALEMGAHRCEELAPLVEVDEATLKSISERASVMLVELESSTTIPEELRAVIRQKLQDIIIAIDMFGLYGFQRIRERFEASLGAMGFEILNNEKISEQPEARKFMEFLKDSLVKLQIVKTTMDVGKQLGETVVPLLGSMGL